MEANKMDNAYQKNAVNDIDRVGQYFDRCLFVGGAFLSHNKEIIKGVVEAIKHPVLTYKIYQVFKLIKKKQEKENLANLIDRN